MRSALLGGLLAAAMQEQERMERRAMEAQALVGVASMWASLARRYPKKPMVKYPYHFDMPPSPNESRQVRRARQREMRKARTQGGENG